jgi:hypothetical protein
MKMTIPGSANTDAYVENRGIHNNRRSLSNFSKNANFVFNITILDLQGKNCTNQFRFDIVDFNETDHGKVSFNITSNSQGKYTVTVLNNTYANEEDLIKYSRIYLRMYPKNSSALERTYLLENIEFY